MPSCALVGELQFVPKTEKNEVWSMLKLKPFPFSQVIVRDSIQFLQSAFYKYNKMWAKFKNLKRNQSVLTYMCFDPLL